MLQETQMRPAASRPRSSHTWLRVLLIGLLLYIVGVVILVLTGNPNLFPTIILLGNFLVPVTFVAFFYQRRHLTDVTLPDVALSFFCGGVLGTFAAAVLEPLFIRQLDLLTVFEVGLIEEAAKIGALLLLVRLRHVRHDSETDGVILGAAAGMGFAALESMGYAFTAFLESGGSLSLTVLTTLERGLLSPVGHGTWTAILAGMLFRESRAGRFHFNRRVLAAYLGVAVLHSLWDALPTIVALFTPSGLDLLIGQLVMGAVGLIGLWHIWHQGGAR